MQGYNTVLKKKQRDDTDMLKLVMKAVLGSSTSKKISCEELALFRALEVMTV